MQRTSETSAPAAPTAWACPLEEHDADACAGCLLDVRHALLEPPEFLVFDGSLQVLGAGRDRAIHDDVAIWFD